MNEANIIEGTNYPTNKTHEIQQDTQRGVFFANGGSKYSLDKNIGETLAKLWLNCSRPNLDELKDFNLEGDWKKMKPHATYVWNDARNAWYQMNVAESLFGLAEEAVQNFWIIWMLITQIWYQASKANNNLSTYGSVACTLTPCGHGSRTSVLKLDIFRSMYR